MKLAAQIRTAAAVLLALGALGGASASAASPEKPAQNKGAARGERPLVLTSPATGRFAYRPKRIVMVPDGIFVLHQIRWHHYGPRTATATAAVRARACKPDCNTGPVVRSKAKLRLRDVEQCRAVLAFSSMQIKFKNSRLGAFTNGSYLILPHNHLGEPRCGTD